MIEKIKEILNEVLETADENLYNRETNAEWDSIKHLELIMSIEEEFEVRFTSKEVADIKSIEHIIEFLREKLNK